MDRKAAFAIIDVDAEVERLAARLRSISLTKGQRIALFMKHGRPALVGVCAALRLDRCFIPLDPAWPDSRIGLVIEDASPSVIVADPELAPRLVGKGGPLLLVSDGVAGETLAPPSLTHEPADSATYILYTSGSTGRPKGVVQTVANMVAHARTYVRSMDLRHGRRLSWLAPVAADAGIMDVAAAITTGVTLCAYDPRGPSLSGFAAWLERSGINVLHLTPSLLRALFAGRTQSFVTPGLIRLVLGGEAVTGADIQQSWRLLPSLMRITNGYGPTECTVACQWHTDRQTVVGRRVPIGTPVEGVDVLLRDEAGRLTTGAASGEIVIRSPLVARQYWRRANETERAFGRDPASGTALYATGDLGSRDGDGILYHLGRIDDQLKVAGVRVEPGEVEAVLASVPGIKAAAVGPCRYCEVQHLRAWVVAEADKPVDMRALRAQLVSHLPPAMVPSMIDIVLAFPFTATGKVDRQRLRHQPCPAATAPASAPADPILAVWKQILRVPQVSEDDDFFALGGDSLAALQVTIALEKALGVDVPSIFDHATPAAMKRALNAARRPADGMSACPPAMAFPTPPQRRLLARRKERSAFEIALLIDIEGLLDEGSFRRAVTSALDHHAAACGSEAGVGDPWMHMAPGADDEATMIGHIRIEAARTESAPIARCHLLRRSDDRHLLFLLLDHAWSDGWSRLLLEESIFAAYVSNHLQVASASAAALRMNERSRRFTANWSDWSSERRDTFLSERFGCPTPPAPLLRLPRDGSGRDNAAVRVSEVASDQAAAALTTFARAHRTTPFAVFLALSMIALARFTGQSHITVTTDRLNRFGEDYRSFGLFAEPFPLSANLDATMTLAKLVSMLHSRLGQAQDPDEPFFADLVDLVWPGWLARYDGLFPVAAFLTTDDGPRLRPGGLRTRTREIGTGTISRDLIFDGTLLDGRLTIDVTWRRGRFDGSQMRALLAALVGSIEPLTGRGEEPFNRWVAGV